MWLKALIALVRATMLFSGSVILFCDKKTIPTLLQLLGAACLLVVVLTHGFEAFHMFPRMNWGRDKSIGHYLDFWSAVIGLSLFPAGYLLNSLTKRHS
jgi:hypothetical protein